MLYEIRMAVGVLHNEGFASLVARTMRYIIKWPRYLLFYLATKKHLHSDCSLSEWVDYAFEGYDGLIMPLQVREEINQLLKELQKDPPCHVLEVGTSNGGTLFLLARVATNDAWLISVDLPLGPYGGGYPAWKSPFYRSFALSHQTIQLIRSDSHDPATVEKVRALLMGNRLDLLFIDGDHTYEGVKKDFEMYEPLVREGGRIVLHDIVPHRKELGCGVDRFWDEVKTGREYMEFIENRDRQWGGLGMIVKGPGRERKA